MWWGWGVLRRMGIKLAAFTYEEAELREDGRSLRKVYEGGKGRVVEPR